MVQRLAPDYQPDGSEDQARPDREPHAGPHEILGLGSGPLMGGSRIALLLLALALVSHAAARPPRATASASGAIEGVVRLRNPSLQRTAERYVGAGGEPREVPAIPVVVFVEGPVRPGPEPRASGPLQIVQRNESFAPVLLAVPLGAEVRFPNDDPIFHNVFSYSRAKRFDLGRYRRGESKSVVFDRPGYVKVLCEVHKWMRAGVLVVDNPYYAIVGEDGRFRIDSVPAGRHQLSAESFDHRAQSVSLEVPEGGTARVEIAF